MSNFTRKLLMLSGLLFTSFCFWNAEAVLLGGAETSALSGAVNELNMSEMYVVGAAEVLSISACPPIDPGDGPVVLSTFKNVANNVLNIYVEGEAEPIGVTAGHPIWSEDRQTFVHSDQLQPGERLRSALGKTVRITSIEIRAGPEPVYNLEVAGEHVYSVTGSGLLVHNTCSPQDPDLYVFDKGSRSARLVTSENKNILRGPKLVDGVDINGTPFKATLERILPEQRQQIQAFANKYNVEVIVTGSRARGNTHALSDFDYILPGSNKKIRSKVGKYLPRGPRYVGQYGPKPGFDIIKEEAFNPKFTHIIFSPGG